MGLQHLHLKRRVNWSYRWTFIERPTMTLRKITPDHDGRVPDRLSPYRSWLWTGPLGVLEVPATAQRFVQLHDNGASIELSYRQGVLCWI